MSESALNTIPELIEDIRNGKMVILVDDESRENEGDLVIAADFITTEAVNFMVQEARGLVCLALGSEHVDQLRLPQMVAEDRNYSPNKTAFTVSIEAASGVTTGISAADRAHTIRVASRPTAKPSDVITPGHVFPIRAQVGGVLRRAGHTEGSVDLVRLAGLNPAATICEVMKSDGTMARLEDLKQFAKKHGLKIGTIVDLISHRVRTETFVKEISRTRVHTRFGEFEAHLFRNLLDGSEHLALQKGDLAGPEPVLVRVHVENIMGDVFANPRSESSWRLENAMSAIEKEGRGILVYLQNASGLGTEFEFYEMQDKGAAADEIQALIGHKMDEKDYGIGAQILRSLGVRNIRLLVGNSTKRVGLKGYGLEIVEEVSLRKNLISGMHRFQSSGIQPKAGV